MLIYFFFLLKSTFWNPVSTFHHPERLLSSWILFFFSFLFPSVCPVPFLFTVFRQASLSRGDSSVSSLCLSPFPLAAFLLFIALMSFTCVSFIPAPGSNYLLPSPWIDVLASPIVSLSTVDLCFKLRLNAELVIFYQMFFGGSKLWQKKKGLEKNLKTDQSAPFFIIKYHNWAVIWHAAMSQSTGLQTFIWLRNGCRLTPIFAIIISGLLLRFSGWKQTKHGRRKVAKFL